MKRRSFIQMVSSASMIWSSRLQGASLSSLHSVDQAAARPQRKVPFYETSFRGYLIDHHWPDPPIVTLDRLDEKEMANYEQLLRLSRIDHLFLYCKDSWGNAYYETKVGKKHPALKIDYIREMSAILGRNSIAFLAYYSVGLDNYIAATHHDWALIDEGGKKRRIYDVPAPKFYWCCLNSPYRGYVLDQLREIVLGYSPDAVWLDMTALPLCYCSYCEEKFRRSTGMTEIPKGKDAEIHRQLVDGFVYRTLWLEPVREMVNLVKELRPGTPVGVNGGYNQFPRELMELVDYVTVEPWRVYSWWPKAGEIMGKGLEWFANELIPTLSDNLLCGIFCRGLGKNPQLLPGFDTLVFDPQRRTALKAAVGETLASGCRASLYSGAQHVDGTLDHYQFELLGTAYAEAEKYQKYLLDRDSVKCVGLIYSENSRLRGPAGAHWVALNGALAAACYSLYPFDVLPEWEIKAEKLMPFQCLVLPEVECLGEEAARVLKDYVNKGGAVLATLRTSVANEHGESGKDFLLAELLGCRLERINDRYLPNEWGSYLRRESEQDRVWQGLAPTELGVAPPFAEVTPTGGRVLAWHLLPVTVLTGESWVNWWSPPPQREGSRYPAVIHHAYGKGNVFYLSFDLFGMVEKNFLWPRDFFVNLLHEMVPEPPIKVASKHAGVLATTFYQTRKKPGLILHLLNLSVRQMKGQVVPLPGGELIVNHTFLRPIRCREVYPSIREVPMQRSDGRSTIRMPEMEIHSIFEIEGQA